MLKETFKNFEDDFVDVYNRYQELHSELNQYRGKEIGDHDVGKVNELVGKIQEYYQEMWGTITFVAERHLVLINLVRDFNKFIDDLKKAGATEMREH